MDKKDLKANGDKSFEIQGYLDKVEGLYAIGWAFNKAKPEERLKVVVYVDDKPVAEGVADKFREDLLKAGIGDGRYGFEIRLPNQIFKDYPQEVKIKVKDKNVYLQGTVILYKNNISESSFSEADRLMFEEFDHIWFSKAYNIPYISDKVILFQIYKDIVRTHKVSPNQRFNEKLYLLRYKDVSEAVEEGKFLCCFEHYVLYGKREGRSGELLNQDIEEIAKNDFDLLYAFFDEEWYINNYKEVLNEINELKITPFQHYIRYCRQRRYSPNHWFDEEWYIAFYNDTRIAVEEGFFICGFHEYLKVGKNLGKIPKRKAFDIINFKFRGAVDPVGIERIKAIQDKLINLPVNYITYNRPRINIVVPTLDKDIMFGGYISLIELIKKLKNFGFDLRFLICEDHHMEEEYFWYNIEQILNLNKKDREKISFQNLIKDRNVEISNNDVFITYSAFTTLIGYKLASHTKQKKVIYLIQEDERIFYTNNSFRALIDYIYSLPIVFLFNTKDLYDYFKKYEIGPFRKNKNNEAKAYWFECPITQVEKPTINELFERKTKRLLFYARPEAHAERNLFSIGVLAIKKAIEKGYFDSYWSFHGIGAAKKYNVELSNGYILDIVEKMDLDEYKKTLKDYDVGLFLMYAPHPGLVGFEMASAGMIVVVNSFDYRDEEYYRNKSQNFVVAEPHPDALAEALKEAVIKSSDFYGRIKNAYEPSAKNWDEALPDELIREILKEGGLNL